MLIFCPQIIGLSILFGIPIIWLLVSMIIQLCKTPYKSLFEDVYEEETITSAEVEMQKRVKISAMKKCEKVFNKYKTGNSFNWTNLSNELIDVIIEEDPADLLQSPQNLPQSSHSSAKQPASSSKSEAESRDRGSQSSASVISAQIHPFK